MARIPLYEFRLLFKWADTAVDNDEFWRRMLIGSAAYPDQQLAFSNLVALCNPPSAIDEQE